MRGEVGLFVTVSIYKLPEDNLEAIGSVVQSQLESDGHD